MEVWKRGISEGRREEGRKGRGGEGVDKQGRKMSRGHWREGVGSDRGKGRGEGGRDGGEDRLICI